MSPQPSSPDRPPTAAQRKALALARLDASRTLLIQRLYPAPSERGAHAASGDAGVVGLVASLMNSLMARAQRDGLPRAAWRIARALARRWWIRQPWHASVELVAGTLADEVKPVVRRHPWASLAAAAAVGGALVMARPWVVHSLRRQTRDLPHRVGRMLWQQLAQAPVQLALIGALTAWLKGRGQPPPPAPTPTPAPPPTDGP
ncbi:hypothetical protein [Hydrogenophaga pseudoflava]|uniref:Uncharacterized protein n=1 Tax=Hydrogenophaga pseudoflava TaxID=47421 RepID=A0A4V1AC11_HYDPS|nr:hypothetical protein [Hydrogenophaga pseudoflava]QBM29843.1 hypothetical protein HPF_19270 [Hydrogenophaga pseudoflava]